MSLNSSDILFVLCFAGHIFLANNYLKRVNMCRVLVVLRLTNWPFTRDVYILLLCIVFYENVPTDEHFYHYALI